MFAVVAQDEIKLLRATKSMDPSHFGYKHIVQMVDTFKLISVNGVHTAISMEIMGPSLLHLLIQSDFNGIQLGSSKRIISQVKNIIYSVENYHGMQFVSRCQEYIHYLYIVQARCKHPVYF